MDYSRISTIAERVWTEIVESLSGFHPFMHRRPETDVRTYWRGVPEGKRTPTTALVFAILPVVCWGRLIAMGVSLFVGELWMFLLAAYAGNQCYSLLEEHYRLRIARPAGFEQEYPELFADYDVSTKLVDEPQSGSLLRHLGETYLLVDLDMAERMSPEETEATIAHELAHYHHRDGLKTAVTGLVALLPRLLGLWVLVRSFDPFTLTTVVLIAIGVKWLARWQSRRHEYRADRFAADLIGHPGPVELMLYRMQFADLRVGNTLGRIRSHFSTHPLASDRLERFRDHVSARNTH